MFTQNYVCCICLLCISVCLLHTFTFFALCHFCQLIGFIHVCLLGNYLYTIVKKLFTVFVYFSKLCLLYLFTSPNYVYCICLLLQTMFTVFVYFSKLITVFVYFSKLCLLYLFTSPNYVYCICLLLQTMFTVFVYLSKLFTVFVYLSKLFTVFVYFSKLCLLYLFTSPNCLLYLFTSPVTTPMWSWSVNRGCLRATCNLYSASQLVSQSIS